MLLFKKKFLPAIRDGSKTQTIRLWKYRRMRNGQRSYIPGIGYIRVLDVCQVELTELTEEDARLDGFETLDALLYELGEIYTEKLAAGHHPFRVRFAVLPEEENRKDAAQRDASPK
jgi:hypothetical protein